MSGETKVGCRRRSCGSTVDGVNRRWIVALLLITAVGGGLRAREALSPHARQSADERSYVGVAIGLADTGRYGKQSLHWPPGAPVAFAAAAKLSGRVVRGASPDIPAAYWVQWLAGTALIPLAFFLAVAAAGEARLGRATPRDETWTPLGTTPMHPEYPCAHCITSAAVSTVLQNVVGVRFTPRTPSDEPM